MPFGLPHILACIALITASAVAQPVKTEPDRLVLRDGTVLKGRIVAETAATVTLTLDFGGRLEFRKRDLARFERRGGAAPIPKSTAAGAEAREPERIEERFLVYLDDRPVGFRTVSRSRVRRRGVLGILCQEEVTFTERAEATAGGEAKSPTCRVVTLEFIPDGGGARTLYYREVGMGTDYIIDAVLRGEILEYTWLRGGKRTYHRDPLPAGVGFPVASWFRIARAGSAKGAAGDEATSGVTAVFDPRTRRVVPVDVHRFAERRVPVGASKFEVAPVVVTGVRGPRLRWIGSSGRTIKEHLNGVSLVAVATAMRRLPKDLEQTPRPDRREAEFVRISLEPATGLVLRSPGGGWVRSSSPTAGAVFTLLNREMETSISVYWSGPDGDWPGPEAPSGVPVNPIAFGGWPGEGWSTTASAAPVRERVVRRMRTTSGRICAVLDTPQEFASAALLDFAALLRLSRVPGAGSLASSAR